MTTGSRIVFEGVEVDLSLPVRRPGPGRGGARKGAGRKPKGEVEMHTHLTRLEIPEDKPVLATVKIDKGLPSLRTPETRALLLDCLYHNKHRGGFRIAHFTIRADEMQFVVEPETRHAMTFGMQGLMIRIARNLNRMWGRKGRVFADRYHERVLEKTHEVHEVLQSMLDADPETHEYSSAPWCDGFEEPVTTPESERMHKPVIQPHTWLLASGWKRHGLLKGRVRPARRPRD